MIQQLESTRRKSDANGNAKTCTRRRYKSFIIRAKSYQQGAQCAPKYTKGTIIYDISREKGEKRVAAATISNRITKKLNRRPCRTARNAQSALIWARARHSPRNATRRVTPRPPSGHVRPSTGHRPPLAPSRTQTKTARQVQLLLRCPCEASWTTP